MKQLQIKYGIDNSIVILVDRPLTIGKLLSYTQIQERLNYDYHNVTAIIGSRFLDFEDLVGAEDVIISLHQTAGTKEALPSKKLISGLKKLVRLEFKRHGGNHDIWVTEDGVSIVIPRHAGDIAKGTLRSIINDAMPGMTLSDFQKKVAE